MASTINTNETYTILGSTLQGICDSVSKATGSEDIPVPMIPKMIDGINLKYEDIKDVMFMDYNGDLLYSWDKDDFIANVTELPPGPTWHSNLSFQEWNWDLADIKAELGKSGACCIGACYTTKDSATHFYIDIEDEADLNVVMYIGRDSGETVVVNWGDGTSVTLQSSTYTYHTYQNLGEYDVKITGGMSVTNNAYFFRRDPGADFRTGQWYIVPNNFIKRIEFGTNFKIIPNCDSNFFMCTKLTSISVHKDLWASTATNFLFTRIFESSNLRFFVFPKAVGQMSSTTYAQVMNEAFLSCPSLVSVSFPRGFKFFTCSNAFTYSGIKFIYIPYVTTLTQTSKSYFPGLVSVPDLMRVNWAFDSMNLAYINKFHQTFYYNRNLKYVSFDKMGFSYPNRYTCYICCCLSGEITIPATCTQLTGENFYWCTGITKFTFLGDMTAIGVASGYVFYACYSCLEYNFIHCTSVPTLYSTNCFNGIRPTAKIVVPDSLVSSWKTATNWSNSNIASKIIGESDYNA